MLAAAHAGLCCCEFTPTEQCVFVFPDRFMTATVFVLLCVFVCVCVCVLDVWLVFALLLFCVDVFPPRTLWVHPVSCFIASFSFSSLLLLLCLLLGSSSISLIMNLCGSVSQLSSSNVFSPFYFLSSSAHKDMKQLSGEERWTDKLRVLSNWCAEEILRAAETVIDVIMLHRSIKCPSSSSSSSVSKHLANSPIAAVKQFEGLFVPLLPCFCVL